MVFQRGTGFARSGYQMHIARGNAADLVMHRLQRGQKLLNTEGAEGAAALEVGEMQGHDAGLMKC